MENQFVNNKRNYVIFNSKLQRRRIFLGDRIRLRHSESLPPVCLIHAGLLGYISYLPKSPDTWYGVCLDDMTFQIKLRSTSFVILTKTSKEPKTDTPTINMFGPLIADTGIGLELAKLRHAAIKRREFIM